MNNIMNALMAALIAGMLVPGAAASVTVDVTTDETIQCETIDPIWRAFDGVYVSAKDCDAYATVGAGSWDARCAEQGLGPAFKPEARVERDCAIVVRA